MLLFQTLCACLCQAIKVKLKEMQTPLFMYLIKKGKKFFCQAEKTKQHSTEKNPEVSSLCKVKGHCNFFYLMFPYVLMSMNNYHLLLFNSSIVFCADIRLGLALLF